MNTSLIKMTERTYKCPVAGCEYETVPAEPGVAAVERPKLQSLCPKADWVVFMSRWKSFKAATNLPAPRIVHHLLGCLDEEVSKLVYNETASPKIMDELTLLKLIERVAVKPITVSAVPLRGTTEKKPCCSL